VIFQDLTLLFFPGYFGIARTRMGQVMRISCNIEIDAFSSYKLNFTDCSYFPVGKELGKDSLMLQLRIAGRKFPVTLEVFSYS
jgi:hypothetical protein